MFDIKFSLLLLILVLHLEAPVSINDTGLLTALKVSIGLLVAYGAKPKLVIMYKDLYHVAPTYILQLHFPDHTI